MQDIDSLIEQAQAYYNNNNLSIPNSVKEYIENFPPGLSRQVLSKFGIACSDFIKRLNPTYVPPMKAKDRALEEAARLRYTIISDLSLIKNNRDKVLLECIDCNALHTTTITSLQGSKLGCPACKSGNLPWHLRKSELDRLILTNFDGILVSEIPKSQTGSVSIKHNACKTIYTTQLVGIVSPNTKLRGTCPNCRTTDRRVTIDNLTFGSQFEYDCYLKLKHLNPEIQVFYSKYFKTQRKWVCDFKIDKYWIEVSNFKTDYKDYFSNIEDKRNLVESNDNYFFFINSLKELDELIFLL